MEKMMIELLNLINIYLSIDPKALAKDITKIKNIIESLQDSKERAVPKVSAKKSSFIDNYQLLIDKNFRTMTGTKINYEIFTSHEEVVNYVDKSDKIKILKEATALDLKLLYSLLTADPTEIKGTKSDVYDSIKRNIRAGRRGEAFMKNL